MILPDIIVNLKLYRESVGKRAVQIARLAEEVGRETGVAFGIAPSLMDAWAVASEVDIPVFAQHVDPVEPGARTGHVSPRLLREYGLRGSLINHSERRMRLADVRVAVQMLRDEGLASIVCAGDPAESLAAAALKPTAVAFEPPELIGTGVSVSKARPEAVTRAVNAIRSKFEEVAVVCGAGVSTGEDVRRAFELGVDSVLLASAVAKAPRPREKLLELARGALVPEY